MYDLQAIFAQERAPELRQGQYYIPRAVSTGAMAPQGSVTPAGNVVNQANAVPAGTVGGAGQAAGVGDMASSAMGGGGAGTGAAAAGIVMQAGQQIGDAMAKKTMAGAVDNTGAMPDMPEGYEPILANYTPTQLTTAKIPSA